MKNSGLAFIKLMIGIFIFFASIVMIYQIYKYNFVSIKTENAVMGEMEQTLKATGLFFRDEEALSNDGYSYLDVIRKEGERVGADGIVARVYPNEQSAKTQKEIRDLQDKINTYEKVLTNSGSYESASKGIDQTIYQQLDQIAQLVNQENSLDAFSCADDLIIDIMKHKIAAGDLVSYDKTLENLRTELSSLKASAGGSVKNLTTAKSGYFSLFSDGLENTLTMDYLKSMTVDQFDSTLSICQQATKNGSNVGKVIYGNQWYAVLRVPSQSVDKLEKNGTLYIRIPSFGADRIKCTVEDLRKSGEDTLLILSSSMIYDNILTLRTEDVYLVLNSYSGIEIRQGALRKVDGEDGIYVKVGLLLHYKKVTILYSDGINVIVSYDANDSSGIRIYDQVVYKGLNLYDGKAVS